MPNVGHVEKLEVRVTKIHSALEKLLTVLLEQGRV